MAIRERYGRWTVEHVVRFVQDYDGGVDRDWMAQKYALLDAKSVRGTMSKMRSRR